MVGLRQDTAIGDALADVFVVGDVCEALELLLNGLGKSRVGDDGVHGRLGGELGIKVANVDLTGLWVCNGVSSIEIRLGPHRYSQLMA